MTNWDFEDYRAAPDSASPAFASAHAALTRIVESLIAMLDAVLDGVYLPRAAYRAGLRLLLPAEAAARRLILVMACAIQTTAPQRRQKPTFGGAGGWRWVKGGRAVWATIDGVRREIVVMPGQRLPEGAVLDNGRVVARRLARFRLFDPPADHLPIVTLAPKRVPRISIYGPNGYETYPPLPPAPPALPPRSRPATGETVDATAIGRRLGALQRALDNLPKEAQRMARWLARRDRDLDWIDEKGQARDDRRPDFKAMLREVLRPGRPPGAATSEATAQGQHALQPLLRQSDRMARWAEQERQLRLDARPCPDTS